MTKKNPAAVALGALGGSVSSPAKSASSRANGRKGGRPPGKNGTPRQRACRNCGKPVEWPYRVNCSMECQRISNEIKKRGWLAKRIAENPQMFAAHRIVNQAIKSGALKRERCEVCGSFDAHAHHDDYSKPLVVRWLCSQHHVQHHEANPGEFATTFVIAPAADVEAWRRAAKRADMTLNGWLVSLARSAVEEKR